MPPVSLILSNKATDKGEEMEWRKHSVDEAGKEDQWRGSRKSQGPVSAGTVAEWWGSAGIDTRLINCYSALIYQFEKVFASQELRK